ncbi:uncharacterized protein [Temnothorax longispinosus]|uniref:uncharacterized protein isoform X3 n=1 Tax=Temnothorax longispinosus TaxID=300112 RepID=UPI003A99939A
MGFAILCSYLNVSQIIKNFTINEKMRVKCNICKKILIAYSVGYLTMHLKIHNRITGASSSSDMDDMDSDIDMVTPAVEVIRQEASSKNMYEMTQETSQGTNQGTNQGTTQGTSQGTSSNKKTVPNSISDTDNNIDMGTPTKGAKQLDDTDSPRHRMDIMAEAGCPSEDEWMLQYYIPTLMCQECHEPILNNKASSSSYKETLTKLKEHLIHEHKIDHDSVHNIEHDVIKDMIPVRSFIRKHYSKLNGYAAKCNHCFRVINYTVLHSVLHKHLKYKHEEKLTETERNEERVLWYWDYVTIKDEMLAICNYCNAAYKINSLKNLPHHISVHKKTDPRSYSDTDDTDGNTGMKHQEDTNSLRSRTDIMAEQEAEDKWVLQYYIPTLMCQECHDHFLNDKANSSSFKETLTKLREHLFEEHNIKQDSVPNIEYNLKEKLPIRRFIRKRYLKLKGDLASCNYCFGLISFKNKNYNFLHKHLLCKHEDKLTVINKNETKISWYWDYFKKGERNGICTICNRGISLGGIANHMKGHKETYEVLNSSSDIDDPNSDPDDPNSNTDNTNNGTNMDTLTKEAEHQKDTHSPRPRTDVMVEQEAEDKETHEVPSSSSDPDGTNSDTDNANSDTYDTNSDTDDANSDTDDTNALQIQCSDTDMDTLTKEAEHREGTNSPPLRTDIMAEQEAEDEGLLKYYIPTLMCQECHDHFLNDKASTLSFKETLTKLGEHLVCEHNIKQDSVHNIEYDVNKEKIPVRRFIQEHYSKLKKDVAECNHCFALISYKNRNYSILHEHLIRKHEDKLTEIEKNETKFLWFWDYFTIDDTSLAKCNTCNTTFYALTPAFFTDHVRTHEKTVRSSSNDTNSNTDMNMPTKEAICQEDKELRHRTNIMAEQEAGDEWMLQYYIPTLMCQECHDPFLNNKTYSLSYKETLTKLGEHLVCEHNIKQDFVHDIEYDVNKKKIPVRRFIRGHYSKLKGDAAKCNYCFIVICYKNAHNILHEHLKCKHKDKLTEIEKSETNFHWFWDYFTINDKAYAKCHKCNIQFYALTPAFLTDHLKTHEKTDPSSSSDTSDTDNDTEMDTPMREAKH